MKLTRQMAVMMVVMAVASTAFAALTVQPTLVRKGLFQAPDCIPEANPGVFNECLCEADISKATVMGISPSVDAAINKELSTVPEQLASESCDGTPAQPPAKGITYNDAKASYQVVYQTPSVLTVLITYSTYGAGAAHPLEGTEGFTFDLGTGKTVDPLKSLKAEQLAKANAFVMSELVKKYGEKLFDETKSRTDPYLTDNGCDTCTIYYTKDGWNVRFQLYAIAPYSTGEPEVTVPNDLIPAPETLVKK